MISTLENSINNLLTIKSIDNKNNYQNFIELQKLLGVAKDHIKNIIKSYEFEECLKFIKIDTDFSPQDLMTLKNKYDQIFTTMHSSDNANELNLSEADYWEKYVYTKEYILNNNSYLKPKITDLWKLLCNNDDEPCIDCDKRKTFYKNILTSSLYLNYEHKNKDDMIYFELIFMDADIGFTIDCEAKNWNIKFSPLLLTLYTKTKIITHFYKGISNFCGYKYPFFFNDDNGNNNGNNYDDYGENYDIFVKYIPCKYDINNKFTTNELIAFICDNIDKIPHQILLKRKWTSADDNLSGSFDGKLHIVCASIKNDKLAI